MGIHDRHEAEMERRPGGPHAPAPDEGPCFVVKAVKTRTVRSEIETIVEGVATAAEAIEKVKANPDAFDWDDVELHEVDRSIEDFTAGPL